MKDILLNGKRELNIAKITEQAPFPIIYFNIDIFKKY